MRFLLLRVVIGHSRSAVPIYWCTHVSCGLMQLRNRVKHDHMIAIHLVHERIVWNFITCEIIKRDHVIAIRLIHEYTKNWVQRTLSRY